jgi:hypothetical protein
MLRLVPTKHGIALITFVALVDLQIYVHRFHHSPDMLAYYLRRAFDSKSDVRSARARAATPRQSLEHLKDRGPF